MARLPRKYRYLFNLVPAGKRTRKLRQLMAAAGEGSSPTPAPVFTSQPTIQGVSQAGQTLTAVDGTAAFAYGVSRQWYLDGATAGTAQTLALAAGDVGKVPRLRNFASGPGGGPVQSSLATAAAVIAAGGGATEPGQPGAPVATAGDGTVSATWTAPASNGGSAITDYRLRWNGGAPVEMGDADLSGSMPAANGVAGTLEVAALNAIGWGPYSPASNSVTPQAAGSSAVITSQPASPTIVTNSPASFSFSADNAVSYGWEVASAAAPNTWSATGSAAPSLTTGNLTIEAHQGRRYRGWAQGTDGARVYTDVATVTITATPQVPLPEPTQQSMILPIRGSQLTTRANITDNGDGTYTGTAGTDGDGRLAQQASFGMLTASADHHVALEWRGGGWVAVCFAGNNTQSWAGGRWMVLRSTGVYQRDAGVETLVVGTDNIAEGDRFRLARVGTALKIERENPSTGAWADAGSNSTFPAVIGTGALFINMRTTTGVLKPLQGYGVPKSSQSQWVEPGFLEAGGFTFVSTAGTEGELRLTKLVSSMLRGGTQTVATLPPPDDHNRAAILRDAQSKMVTGYTGHNETFYCSARSQSDYGLDFLPEVRVSASPNTISYAELFNVPASSRIVRMHRSGGATSGGWNILYSDDFGATWQGTKRLANFPYMWGVVDPTNAALVWVYACNHPISGSTNNLMLFRMNLTTGDISHPDGTVAANWLSGSGNPLITTASMLTCVDSGSSGMRICDVLDAGTTRAAAIIRFTKGSVDSTGQLEVAVWDTASTAFTVRNVRAAGGSFATDNAYYPGHCFGADANTIWCAYAGATGGPGQTHFLRPYTWNGSAYVAGTVIRSIVGVISRPRYYKGWLYWSELDSYTGTPSFDFDGDFRWQYVG